MNDMTTEYVAAFDAGTTALKGALVNGQGCIVASASSELDLIINGDYREQSPDQWWQAFCSASRHMIEQARQSESEFNVTRIRGIIFSGQMQVVPEFLRTLVFARPRGDDQFADCTFSPSLDMSR